MQKIQSYIILDAKCCTIPVLSVEYTFWQDELDKRYFCVFSFTVTRLSVILYHELGKGQGI